MPVSTPAGRIGFVPAILTGVQVPRLTVLAWTQRQIHRNATTTLPCLRVSPGHTAIHDSTLAARTDLVSLVQNKRFLDILDYHSTVEQAAQTAQRAGVKKLILTHYVPSIQPGQEEEWRALAAAHFSGEIILGDDLTTTSL